MRTIIFFILIQFSFQTKCFGKNTHTIYFIFSDANSEKKEIIDKVNFMIEHSNLHKFNCNIIHYSKKQELSETWALNKNNLEYVSTLLNCDFDLNTEFSTILTLTKTNFSKVFYLGSKIESISKINNEFINKNNESTIIASINEELVRLKDIKTPETIYFLWNMNIPQEILNITFENDIISVNESTPYKLLPKIEGAVLSYEWSPKKNLNCYDCPNPTLYLNESTVYTLEIKDSSGCNVTSKSINVQIEKKCKCESGMTKLEIPFTNRSIEKYLKKDLEITADWQYKILSYQSGGYLFEIISKPNCAEKFNLKILRKNGEILFDDDYLLEQIDLRSESDYHDDQQFKDYFVFRIDLTDQVKILDNPRDDPYFIIELTPYDDNSILCTEKKYVSPKVRFTKCN